MACVMSGYEQDSRLDHSTARSLHCSPRTTGADCPPASKMEVKCSPRQCVTTDVLPQKRGVQRFSEAADLLQQPRGFRHCPDGANLSNGASGLPPVSIRLQRHWHR